MSAIDEEVYEDPNTGLPCGCDECNPDVALPDWDGYMDALRNGALREAGAP